MAQNFGGLDFRRKHYNRVLRRIKLNSRMKLRLLKLAAEWLRLQLMAKKF